jgi:hypothetical protein
LNWKGKHTRSFSTDESTWVKSKKV